MNIILCGFMGSGKTTVGKALARKMDFPFVDMDVEIEKRECKKISDIFSDSGEEYFRKLETDLCLELSQKKDLIISTGGGVMTFPKNVEILKKQAIVVYLDVPFDVIRKRVGNSDTRPLFQNKYKAEKLYIERKSLYAMVADITVDGDGSMADVAQRIFNEVKLLCC